MKHKKTIALIIAGIITILLAGTSIYFYRDQKEQEARAAYESMSEKMGTKEIKKMSRPERAAYKKKLQAFINAYPTTTIAKTVQYQLGKVYMEEKEYKQAIDTFLKCADMPDLIAEAERLFSISSCYFYLARYDAALTYIERAIAENMPISDFRHIKHQWKVYEKVKEKGVNAKKIIQKQKILLEKALKDFRDNEKIYQELCDWRETLTQARASENNGSSN